MTRPGFDEAVAAAARAMHGEAPYFWAVAEVGPDVRRFAQFAVEAAYPVILEAAAAEIERARQAEQSRNWPKHWESGMVRAEWVVRELAAKDPVKQGETT